jgi:hypothetical protein
VLRSTAPENSPKTPENSHKTEFSTVWTNSFHCVEKRRKVFPLRGILHVINPSRPRIIVRHTYKMGLLRVVGERRGLGLIAITGRWWYKELLDAGNSGWKHQGVVL